LARDRTKEITRMGIILWPFRYELEETVGGCVVWGWRVNEKLCLSTQTAVMDRRRRESTGYR
jgi:hypothetical protein